jgi:GDP-L-fucose synthase
MKIYVAGHRGLVGSAIVRNIESHAVHTWVGKSREELDLFDAIAVENFIAEEKPDAVIVAAAKVGGIGANSSFPVDFLVENLKIQINLIESAHKQNIDRLLFLGSSCIYPKFALQPIKEDYLLTGALEPTNEPYALAKIAGIKTIQAYAKQYGRDWISAMLTNIYGPGDNFNIVSGHVLPTLINKFHQAKLLGNPSVELWGTGSPMREFLHSDDLASACLFLLENYHSAEHINVGTGVDVTIKELAELVANIVGFKGRTAWNADMPDGTPRKVLDVSKLSELGWRSQISLSDGIASTYEWFLSQDQSAIRV